MDCGQVREAISAADRRRLRSRRIRSHLRDCASCRGFEASIAERRADLAVLAPPIALPAALAAIKGAVGSGATGAAAGGAATGAARSAPPRPPSPRPTVLAAIAIAGGAAEVSGLADLGGSERRPAGSAAPARARGARRPHALHAPALGHRCRASVSARAPTALQTPLGAADAGTTRSGPGHRRAIARPPRPVAPALLAGEAHGSRGQAQTRRDRLRRPRARPDDRRPPGRPETPPGQTTDSAWPERATPRSATPPGQSADAPRAVHNAPRPGADAPRPGPDATGAGHGCCRV